jgi:hypothetical protein
MDGFDKMEMTLTPTEVDVSRQVRAKDIPLLLMSDAAGNRQTMKREEPPPGNNNLEVVLYAVRSVTVLYFQ